MATAMSHAGETGTDGYEDMATTGGLNYIDQVRIFRGIETALDEDCGEARANLQVTDHAYIGLPKGPDHPGGTYRHPNHDGTYECRPLDKYPEKRFFVLPNYLIGADWINPHVNANRSGRDQARDVFVLYSFKVKQAVGPVDVFVAYSAKTNYYVYSHDTTSPIHHDVVFSAPKSERARVRVPEFILEKTAKPTSFPAWLYEAGWTNVYENIPDWRGLEVNEEPDTGKTEYYSLYKKTFQPGETVNLGCAFYPEAYNPDSPVYDETVADGQIMPYLVFIRPSMDLGTMASGNPTIVNITSPNSTRMNQPERIYGTLSTQAEHSVRVTVKEESTGRYLDTSKQFAWGRTSLAAVTVAADDERTAWELDVSGVDFKRARHNRFATVNCGDRYMIDVITKTGDFSIRTSMNFLMFFKESPPENWEEVWNDYVPSQIEKYINPPDIPNPENVIRVTDQPYGAHGYQSKGSIPDEVADRIDSAKAINDAIRDCARLGGGRVVVPADAAEDRSYFVDGPVWLEDNVELHLEEGTRLVFGFSPEKYPSVLTRWGGYLIYNYSPLINVYGKKNVALTGNGIIDGNNNAPGKSWHDWYGSSASKDESVYNMMAMCDARVPLELRWFGYGAGPGYEMLRPSLVQLYECENVLIEDVQFMNSPFYNLDVAFCESVMIRGITIHPLAFESIYNDDGIDVVSSNYVLVEDCDIFVSDDAIVVKSGANTDAWGRKPSSNMILRNNRLRTSRRVAGAIAMGSDMSGGVFNVFARGNHVPHAAAPCYLKASGVRGGEVSHVYFKDTTAEDVQFGVWFQTNYYFYGASTGTFPAHFTKVFIDGLTVEHTTGNTVNIQGLPEMRINNIYFNDVVVHTTDEEEWFANTEKIFTNNFRIPSAPRSEDAPNPPLKEWYGDGGGIPPTVRSGP